MKNRTKTLIAALACAGVASAALAHDHGPVQRAERMLERMDTDGDGIVTREDARAFAAARFVRADADGDGTVTREERRAARRAARSERIARMDTDGDGNISEAEMLAVVADRAARRFARMDADGDGLVPVAEITDRRAARVEGRAARREGGKAAGRGPVTRATMEKRVLQRFDRLDTDGDGTVVITDLRRARR